MGFKDLAKTNGSASPREALANLPVVTEPRCNVCKSEFRSIIDRMIAGPYSYMAIARQFQGKDPHLSGKVEAVRKSIERHAKNHVQIRDAAIREIIEQRAQEAGLLVDDVKNSYLTAEALLELYMHRGFERVTEEGTNIRDQDILEAVKVLQDMRKDTVGEELEVMKKQVYAISQAVREIVPPEMHPAVVSRAYEIFEEQGTTLPKREPPRPTPTIDQEVQAIER